MMDKKNNGIELMVGTETFFRCRDDRTAQVVKNGLLLQKISGTNRAAAYLKSYGVSLDVAMRVLSCAYAKRRTN